MPSTAGASRKFRFIDALTRSTKKINMELFKYMHQNFGFMA